MAGMKVKSSAAMATESEHAMMLTENTSCETSEVFAPSAALGDTLPLCSSAVVDAGAALPLDELPESFAAPLLARAARHPPLARLS
mmetsp:Transcript_12879/g.32522  ORF Transcript_12879/g.32522 Transcript_12879/m.32522 type:complete len:86 (+) Transcript_12879:598-855(+)